MNNLQKNILISLIIWVLFILPLFLFFNFRIEKIEKSLISQKKKAETEETSPLPTPLPSGPIIIPEEKIVKRYQVEIKEDGLDTGGISLLEKDKVEITFLNKTNKEVIVEENQQLGTGSLTLSSNKSGMINFVAPGQMETKLIIKIKEKKFELLITISPNPFK